MSMMKVFNKGKRVWPVDWEDKDGKKVSVQIGPSQSKDIPKEKAEKLIKAYPRELVNAAEFAGTVSKTADPKEVAALKDEIEKKDAELKNLQIAVDQMKRLNDDLLNQIAELKGLPVEDSSEEDIPEVDFENSEIV